MKTEIDEIVKFVQQKIKNLNEAYVKSYPIPESNDFAKYIEEEIMRIESAKNNIGSKEVQLGITINHSREFIPPIQDSTLWKFLHEMVIKHNMPAFTDIPEETYKLLCKKCSTNQINIKFASTNYYPGQIGNTVFIISLLKK